MSRMPEHPIAAVPPSQLGPLPRVRVVARGSLKVKGSIEICRTCRRAVAVVGEDCCGSCLRPPRRRAPSEGVWSGRLAERLWEERSTGIRRRRKARKAGRRMGDEG